MCVQCVWERADMQASSHSQKVTQHLTHSQAAQIHCTTHGHNTMCVCVRVCEITYKDSKFIYKCSSTFSFLTLTLSRAHKNTQKPKFLPLVISAAVSP